MGSSIGPRAQSQKLRPDCAASILKSIQPDQIHLALLCRATVRRTLLEPIGQNQPHQIRDWPRFKLRSPFYLPAKFDRHSDDDMFRKTTGVLCAHARQTSTM
jgi:hypothetical protein